jgi:hypothetical protein
MGPNRPGPKGFRDLPIGIDGLYLGGAGCHGITFIPEYNAGYRSRQPRLNQAADRAGLSSIQLLPPVRVAPQSHR